MVTSITSGRLVVFKKTVWVGIKPKLEKKMLMLWAKPTKILHNVTVVVVLEDVFDPLVALQITSTLRFWLMTGSSLDNVDLDEILFTFQNIHEFSRCLGDTLLHWLGNCDASLRLHCLFLVGHRESSCTYSRGQD